MKNSPIKNSYSYRTTNRMHIKNNTDSDVKIVLKTTLAPKEELTITVYDCAYLIDRGIIDVINSNYTEFC